MRLNTIINDLQRPEKVATERVSKEFSLTEKMTLKIVRTGTDRVNFKILEMLPSNIETIMKESGLTKVPINIRVNELERVGLVDRFKGTGRVILTDFGKSFLIIVGSYEQVVRERVLDILNKHLN